MKKLLIILLTLIFITSCSLRNDYLKLSIDDYSVTVGYDNAKFLKIAYDFELPEKLAANEVIDNVEIYLFDQLLGVASFTNPKDKEIDSDKAILTRLELYVNDMPNRTIKLNDELLDNSIKTNCDNYNGQYIEKNGYACVIENEKTNELNVAELHGDYLNIDQDELDHIVIYVK